jgi:UDP-N-acetylmuramate dehydrogenase
MGGGLGRCDWEGAGMMANTKTAYGEEGLSLSKARLEPAVLRDAISTSSTAPQDERFPIVRGKLTPNAPLAPLVWFKSGGNAEWLFEPKDVADLQDFVRDLDPATPIWPLGLGSNLIVRDGGVAGVTVRLGKAFAKMTCSGTTVACGGGASGILVSSTTRDAGIAGLEFLRGIPGTVGGFVRMNGGAYGREVKDILIDCDVVLRSGELVTLPVSALGYTYRHSELPEGCVVVSATFIGTADDPKIIGAEMDRIAAEREASQPLRSKTGGSTFKNPDGQKAWQLVDEAGCRGLKVGGAQVSEKHTNFLLNTGDATSADIEALGEEVRKRVKAHSGIILEWEIQRVGLPLPFRGEGRGEGESRDAARP